MLPRTKATLAKMGGKRAGNNKPSERLGAVALDRPLILIETLYLSNGDLSLSHSLFDLLLLISSRALESDGAWACHRRAITSERPPAHKSSGAGRLIENAGSTTDD